MRCNESGQPGLSDTHALRAPLISVVIPAYNYAETLCRAVTSVLEQLVEASAELIVIDDGSTDHTPEVIEQLKKNNLQRFRSLHQENGGLASVRNLGIKEATGQYLVFLDADDELAPGALAALEQHIRDFPATRMVIGGHCAVRKDGRRKEHLPPPLPDSPIDRLQAYLLDKSIALSNGACAMHREVFSRGNYPEQFRNAEDIPVFAQALANFPCTTLEHVLALIHKHDDSLRHQLNYAKAGGVALVDEVFSSKRLGHELMCLKQNFFIQRCLSLFRIAYLAGEKKAAWQYYRQALRADKAVLLKWSYTRKAVRLWLGRFS